MPYEMAVYDREIIKTHVEYVFCYDFFTSLHRLDAELHPGIYGRIQVSCSTAHGQKLTFTYAQNSSFPSSLPGRCGCPPHRRCSGPVCRPSACSIQRSRLRSSTRRRRRGRSSAARSARRSARPGTSPHRWPVSSWSPDGSQGCFGCLEGNGKVLNKWFCKDAACIAWLWFILV